ncbi:MAG: TatD family hydrolase [Candidatus Doudnabacteria bacterium]|nr:TatD family hydrolase [Candidatus Doudnabacteria bacterium]
MSKLVDTHSHLNFQAFREDAGEVISRALDAGVWMINIGTQFETSRRAVELAENYSDGVYAAVGLHPIHLFEHHVDEEETSFNAKGEEFDVVSYKELVQRSVKVVAIGEFGLDYYRMPKGENPEKVKQLQKEVFEKHLNLAVKLDKAAMIHCRSSQSSQDAYEDILRILDEFTPSFQKRGEGEFRFEIHSFTGDWSVAQEFLKRGAQVALNGIITFDKTGRSEEVVKNLPLDRTLLETDAPYLTPVPHRGRRNEPSYVRHVAEKIAEIKNLSYDEVAEQTTKNARKLFRI